MAAKLCIVLLFALALHATAARNVPAAKPKKDAAGLKDQKNFIGFGGVGGYSGLGANGLPVGGVGAGIGGLGGGGGIGGGFGAGGGVGGGAGLGGGGGGLLNP